eukprot:10397983-Ditylum_brightwellii.AAC.1
MLKAHELLLKKDDFPIKFNNNFPAGFPGFWWQDFNDVSLEGIQQGEESTYRCAKCYHKEDRPWVEVNAMVWDVFIK